MGGLAGFGLRPRSPRKVNVLDLRECERARVTRDRRYDGLFFIGVATTKIYCRPVCPVRAAKACNVSFFPSAAAAEAAGYRPCLRCRPEAAPFSPAWRGSRTTVERALRLIENGALDDGDVEELAHRLGIGPRHLGRLFQRHVNASPIQVAQTARVKKQTPDRRDQFFDGRDRDALGLSQCSALQRRLCRSLPAPADSDASFWRRCVPPELLRVRRTRLHSFHAPWFAA